MPLDGWADDPPGMSDPVVQITNQNSQTKDIQAYININRNIQVTLTKNT
jgi:hypothetical protein